MMLKKLFLSLTCAGWAIAQNTEAEEASDNPCAAVSKLYQESTSGSLFINNQSLDVQANLHDSQRAG